MAITKQRKEEVLETYRDWMKRSQAVILVEYTGAKMKNMDAIRSKIREVGGEFHVVKNTLVRRVLSDNGWILPESYFTQSTAVSFAFTDPAATAKALSDATKGMEFVKVKGGFMAGQALNSCSSQSIIRTAAPAYHARTIARRFAGSGWQAGPHDCRTRALTGFGLPRIFGKGTGRRVSSLPCDMLYGVHLMADEVHQISKLSF